MTVTGWIQIVVLIALLTASTPLLGGYMAKVYRGDRVTLTVVLGPIERLLYRGFGVDRRQEQRWTEYARSLVLFSAASWLILYVVLRTQRIHPFNPQGFTHSGPWNLSFNTASSFVSNTSWQYYAGETTLSDFSQMAGITVASFTSMAAGMAVPAALIRGLARRSGDQLGIFWVDLVRSLLYVVLPLACSASIILVATGVPQTLGDYLRRTARPEPTRRSRSDRLPRRRQSSCCRGTAAASSTSTRPTLSRTPAASQTSLRCC